MPKEQTNVKSQKIAVKESVTTSITSGTTAKSDGATSKKAVAGGPKAVSLSIPIYSLEGKESGKMDLPGEVFGAKVNKPLLAQAIRVYSNNLKAHWSDTKTRGEVKGSTRKIYRQKGTGHARHGAITAPLFVGGGIALGPKFRKVILDLPKKMRRAAFLSALSVKALEGEVLGLAGVEKVSGKTSEMREFFHKLGKENVLLITDVKNDKVSQAVRNLPKVEVLPADNVNTLNIIGHKTLVLTKEAIERLELRIKEKIG